MNTRLQKMIVWGIIPNKGGVFIDAYNQTINEDITGTLTRSNTSSHYFVTESMTEIKIISNPHGFNKGGEKDIAPACTSSKYQDNNIVRECRYRIRKLTPRECFRLMGVDDKDIDKIQAAGISNSQQYKLAGNSIVVDVLYNIFRKAFCETHNENIQQTLF